MTIDYEKLVSGYARISKECAEEIGKQYNLSGLNVAKDIKCPAHKDERASLSIKLTYQDKNDEDIFGLVVHCHAGCESKDIYEGLGIEYESKSMSHWDYFKEDGSYNHTKIKYEYFRNMSDERLRKQYFNAIRLSDGSYDYKEVFSKVPRILYNLPKLKGFTGIVLIVEGEKDVDTIEQLEDASSYRVVATTSGNGAKSWRDEFVDNIKDAEKVVIIPDNDKAGEDYLDRIVESLHKVNYKEVYRVTLPGNNLKGSDITDWVSKIDDNIRGHSLTFLIESLSVKIEYKDPPPATTLPFSSSTPVVNRFYLKTLDNPSDPNIFLNRVTDEVILKVINGSFYKRNIVTRHLSDYDLSYEYEAIEEISRITMKEHLGNGQIYELWEREANKDGADSQVAKINLVDYLIDYPTSCGVKLKEVKSVEFDPSLPTGLSGDIYNEFHGWCFEPKQCDTSEYWGFVAKYICINSDGSTNWKDFNLFKSFFAQRFQKPAVKPLVFLQFYSSLPGAGRGTVLTPLLTLMGDYAADVSWDDVLGDKNASIRNKLMIFITDKPAPVGSQLETLKSLVTELYFRLRAMRTDTKSIKSFAVPVVQCNKYENLVMEEGERRGLIITTPSIYVEDLNHVDRCASAFKKFMTKEMLQGILYDLLNFDYSSCDFVKEAKTRASADNRALQVSRDGMLAHLRHVLQNAQFAPDCRVIKYSGPEGANYRFPTDYVKDDDGKEVLDDHGNKIPIYKDPKAEIWKDSGNGWIPYREQFQFYQEFCKRNNLSAKYIKLSEYKKAFEREFLAVGYTLTSKKRSLEGYNYPSWDVFSKIVEKILGDED